MQRYLNSINTLNIKDKSKDKISIDQEDSCVSNLNNSASINFNISNFNDEDLGFEEYKKEVDKQIEEKKKKIEQLYPQPKTEDLEKTIREELYAKYQLVIKEEKERMNQVKVKKKEEMKKKYEILFEEFKQKIKNEEEEIFREKVEEKKRNLNEEIILLEEEILQLKNTHQKLKLVENKDEGSFENEIIKIEEEYRLSLKNLEAELDKGMNSQIANIKGENLHKKIEYETNLKKSLNENEKSATENLIQEKKNFMKKSHLDRIEQIKENIAKEYEQKLEEEKFQFAKNLESFLQDLKFKYEQTQLNYQHQKLLYKTELKINHSTSLNEKIKNIFENKNAIFKNLLDHNYFILKKKLRECENTQELNSFTNKETILNKINEFLTMLFYGSIYEFLLSDINDNKEIISSQLENIILQIEEIILTLNNEKKVQLNLIVNNTNFNL
jgi:hypothetical protein